MGYDAHLGFTIVQVYAFICWGGLYWGLLFFVCIALGGVFFCLAGGVYFILSLAGRLVFWVGSA